MCQYTLLNIYRVYKLQWQIFSSWDIQNKEHIKIYYRLHAQLAITNGNWELNVYIDSKKQHQHNLYATNIFLFANRDYHT